MVISINLPLPECHSWILYAIKWVLRFWKFSFTSFLIGCGRRPGLSDTHTHITVDANYKKVAELHLVYRTDPPSEPDPVKKLRQGRQDLEVPPPQHLIPEEVCRRKGNRPKTVQVSEPGFRRWFHATPFSNANLPRFGCEQWGDKIRK